jgi:hypothetical protein
MMMIWPSVSTASVNRQPLCLAGRRSGAITSSRRVCRLRRYPFSSPAGTSKRHPPVMGRFPGETSCLTLVWAVLDLLIAHQTNGVHFTALDRQHLRRARYQGTEQPIPQEVAAA